MTLPTFALLWLVLGIACTVLGAILTTRRRDRAAREEQL